MNKIPAIVLTALLALSLSACGSDPRAECMDALAVTATKTYGSSEIVTPRFYATFDGVCEAYEDDAELASVALETVMLTSED